MDEDAVSSDRILGGRLVLFQPKQGYRAGLDAALLAAACDAAPGARVLEPGCGAGGALLAASARLPDARFTGLERDPQALALAHRNVEANGLAERIELIPGDVGAGFAALGQAPFDAALCNPPFFDDPSRQRAPHPSRSGAHMDDEGLEAWVGFLLRAVREGGSVTLIHRADRLADILARLAAKAGSVRIRPIHPHADQPAKRVLVRAVKAGKAPLELLPPLVLHDRSGAKHTPEAEAILRGEAGLPWS